MAGEIGHICNSSESVISLIGEGNKDLVERLSPDSKAMLENFNSEKMDQILAVFASALAKTIETKTLSRTFFWSFIALEKSYLFLKKAYFFVSGNKGRWTDFTQRFGYFDEEKVEELVTLCNENLGTQMVVKRFSRHAMVLEKDGKVDS